MKGVTSNPSIFEKAIGESDEYADALKQFQAGADHSISAIYEHLAIADIQSAAALAKDPQLKEFSGLVQDSGEGRWTVEAAIEEAVPANMITAALYARFRSRQEHTFGEKILSALRFGFGGHVEGQEPTDPEPKPKDSQRHSAARHAAE